MSDNIKVAIKVRPLIDRERDTDQPLQWTVNDTNNITQIDPETQKQFETYTFDYIFDQTRTNIDVFNATVKPLVEAAMLGFNGTIFAYGQTSSGKTYTMMGSKSEPGVIPLAVASIFEHIKNDQKRDYLLSVSYLEIYNEKVNDLLAKERKDLKVREENGEIKVDSKMEVAHSIEDILHMMKRGDKNRRIGETNMNERSSRSHTIFTIGIESVLRSNEDGDAIVAKLNLIDLAGSERASATGATGERFNEGRHINLSLSTLGLVIKQLSENSEKSKVHKHISYRDSKLTRILQPSLGGNSLTTIICAVTPAAGDETLCTLAFAQRAKGVKNKPRVNETGSDEALVKRFRKQVQKLEENLQTMGAQLEAKDDQLKEIDVLRGRIELLKTKILSGAGQQQEPKRSQNRRRTWCGSGSGGGGSFETPLPTIQEAEARFIEEEEEKTENEEYIKRRQSVFQNVQFVGHDESSDRFVEFEDFEVQLVKDEQERMAERWSNGSTTDVEALVNFNKNRVNVRRVRFEEDNEQMENSTSPDACTTPEKNPSPDNISSPGTPKADLRKTLKVIQSEYDQLRQYTTLEKQIFKDSSTSAESSLAFMQKSLVDTEQICKDLNKKYAELQSEHVILKRDYEKSSTDCQMLRKQVETLTINSEKLNPLENERDIFKNKFNETMKKLKILEDETSSHAYAMELTIQKHKARESELEASLNSAWEELNFYKSDNKHSEKLEDKKLEIIINDLKGKIELSNFERQKIEEKQKTIVAEFLEKIDNYEKIIFDNNQFRENQEKIVGEFLKKIDNYEREINEKNLQLTENSGILEKLRVMEEKIEFLNSEKEEITRNYENTILELSIKIGNYEKEIVEKNGKLSESLEVYENLKLMKDKIELSNSKVIQLTEDNERMISEFSLKMKNYEDEIIVKTSKIADFEKEITEKNSKISDFEKEICEKNSKISEFENEISEKNSKISDFEKEICEKNSKISEFENEILAKDSKISDFENEIFEKNSRISDFENEISEKNSKISDFEKEISGNNSKISDFEKQISEKNSKISDFEKKIIEFSSKIEKSEISVEKTDENELKLKENEEKIEKLTENLMRKNDEESALKAEISELKLTLEETKSNLSKLEVEKCELLRKIEEKQLDIKAPKLNLSSNKTLDETSIFANTSYFDSSCMDISTTSLITSLSASVIDPEKSILDDRQLHDLADKSRDELLSTIATFDMEYKKLLNDYKLKIRATEEIQSYLCGIKIDMENLQKTILSMTNENAELTSKLTQQKEQFNSINLNELKEKIELFENEKIEFSKKIEFLENEKIEFSKKIEILENEKVEFSKKIEILENERIEFSKKIEILENEKIEFSKIEILENEKIELSKKIEILENEKIEISQKIDISENENTELSTNLMEKIERIEVLERENVELSSNLMEKIEEYDETIKKLKEDNSSKDYENCAKCAHLSELIQARRALKNDVKSADKKLQELNEEFQKKSADVEKLQSKANEDFNISSILNDTVLNGSICESSENVDAVAYVEEKVQKLNGELGGLKSNYEKLSTLYEEKCSEIEELKEDGKISRIKEQLQKHREDVQKVKQYVDSVMTSLENFKTEKLKFDENFKELQKEKELIVQNFNEERELLMKKIEKIEFTKNSEKQELDKKIELLSLEKAELQENYEKQISQFSEKSKNEKIENDGIFELDEARDYIKKEIISLKPDIILDSEMNSIINLFNLFITTIMSKEKEIMHSLQSSFKKERGKLEEENKQLADAQKRSIIWAKELESEIESLQSKLSASESSNSAKISALLSEIASLKNHLKEVNHEKKLLDEKVRVMEADYLTLQNDLDSSPKSQKIEKEEIDKIVQSALLSVNLENSSKLLKIESSHRSKIEEYENSIECLKTKNLELRNTIDGLTAKEDSMRSIIDLKTIDCEKSAAIINKLEEKLRELSENYEQSLEENRKSSDRIEDLMHLLKIKCDKLSEYKTSLESIHPEFELLKDESIENGKRLEKYKSEIEYLRQEKSSLTLALKEAEDILQKEVTRSTSCSRQLQDAVTKNAHLQEACEKLQSKWEACASENERLSRKVRNSTSRLTAERDIEDLKDEMSGLKKSLDGASNRIVELQMSRKDLAEENDKLKIVLEELQMSKKELMEEREKLKVEIEELKAKNKELDEEMDEIVERMKEMDAENGQLETQLYENERKREKENVSDDYKVMKSEYEGLMVKFELLAKENAELKGRACSSEGVRSGASSRSTSPVPSVVRRKRRSDLFNQNRQELAKELIVAEEINCNCENFREKIAELEHELVLKKGKITALEMKISGLCVPYKKKCEDYEEKLGVYKRSLVQVKEEMKRMKEREGGGECERCRGWRERRRDAAIQCMPEPKVMGFAAPKSGIVEDQRLIDKLEKDKSKLKELCTSRCHEIKSLTKRVRELEQKLADASSQLPHSSTNEETKENISINILGQSKSISPSNYYRINQS